MNDDRPLSKKERAFINAIWPTQCEEALGWLVLHAYRFSEDHGWWAKPAEWFGDRADDLRVYSRTHRTTTMEKQPPYGEGP